MAEDQFAGRLAVVIGAAGEGNMGQAIARRLAAEGATCLVAGRHAEPLEALAREIGGHAAVCDITSESDLAALGTQARGLGGVDIAVNATGWGLIQPFLETTRQDLDRMVALQFTGAFQFYQAMLRAMNDGGSLIQVTSATATIMLEDHAAYMGTKAGADHVLRCVANEFGHRGIRANSIAPGFTATPMTERAARNAAIVDCFAQAYPLGRVGTSDDVAAGIVWLASDECFMTGETLHVSGGLRLRRNPTTAEIVEAARKARAAREDQRA
ncbi:SDR family oxidoreductase [Croceicoccus marinus]|uniref:Oxidoreductase n=1 Tax=Croceicoccus marinus TaxID=450378 RepID=A0A1Z1FGH4_9SPHN|nr:SDR family oxidoreductase [Croceicoccus marinus]ARU17911.1 oxidoreductase [Croceicoccus marinus]QNE07417.1 SDR family oxidoreductase [Croceicoccus marinus]